MPSAFTGALTVTELDADWRLWRLEQPLTYEVGAPGSGRAITVPAGFVTDGASVPRFLWWLLPTWGRYSRAAVIHDHLCVLIDNGTPHPLAPTRRAADAIFFDAMGALGVGLITRWTLWLGVRWGALLHALGGPPERNEAYDASDRP